MPFGSRIFIKTIDQQHRTLIIDGEKVQSQSSRSNDVSLTAFHVSVTETTVIPAHHQMRLPVRIQGGVEDTTAGLIEPSTKFGERHNILTVIEVLNPTLVPVTVYARENVGKFQPLL